MRPLRGKVVEVVTHPVTKRAGKIRMDKHLWFFARENDLDTLAEPFSSKSGGEVKAWLLEQLKHTTGDNNLEWQPVIQIEHGGDSRHYYRDSSKEEYQESVELEIKRFWLALTRDQREWRQLPWEACDEDSSTFLPDNDRYAASRKFAFGPKAERSPYDEAFRIPSFGLRGHGAKITVAFTPDLWAGLLLITKQLKAARVLIEDLVGTKKGVAAVSQIGAGTGQLLLVASTDQKGRTK